MKKILQYVPFAYQIHSGGLEKIAQTLHTGLQSTFTWWTLASDITTIGGNKSVALEHNLLLQPSIEVVHNYPIPRLWNKEFWTQLKLVKSLRPDVIITHTRFFFQSFLGGILAKVWGCKRIHIEHGSGFVAGYPRYIKWCAWLFDRTIGLWIFRQCDTIVTISHMHKTFIKKFTQKDPLVIYNPIDYTPQEKINNTIPHIGFVGRLVPLKGVNLLIDALYELIGEQRICTIVGEGSQRNSLEEQTKRLGLSERITFVGADDRSNRLHKFDIFVNPSYQEGLPTTVVEALLAGCAVVATDVGGTREISDKEDVRYILPGNVDALKNAIVYYLEHLSFSGLSKQVVHDKFSRVTALDHYAFVFTL